MPNKFQLRSKRKFTSLTQPGGGLKLMRTGRITRSEPCGSFAIDRFLRYSASKWLKKKRVKLDAVQIRTNSISVSKLVTNPHLSLRAKRKWRRVQRFVCPIILLSPRPQGIKWRRWNCSWSKSVFKGFACTAKRNKRQKLVLLCTFQEHPKIIFDEICVRENQTVLRISDLRCQIFTKTAAKRLATRGK